MLRMSIRPRRLVSSACRREPFDVIASNPPYVAAGDPHLGEGDVRFEPVAALMSGADGPLERLAQGGRTLRHDNLLAVVWHATPVR